MFTAVRPLVVSGALVVASIPALQAQSPPVQGWTAARFQPLAERARAADARVTPLEGLPHQLVEHSSYLRERATQSTVEVGGYSFYKTPLPLAPGDTEALRATLFDPQSYHPYSGPKRCGGFHPDYALRWGDGRDAVYTLICFGCHETQTLSRKECLVADLPDAAFQRLQAVLDRYHARRPVFRKG